jgi:HEPN domain-containing protein
MDEDKRHEIQQWLIKSERDLQASRALINDQEPLFDIAVYHCQQAAEKA